MKKVFRSIQTWFPFLHDTRFTLKFFWMKMRNKPHEPDFNALLFFKPKPDEVLVDIGSNRGESILSMLIASKANYSNKIIGFEPNYLIFEKLKNYFRTNKRVSVYNFGLANKDRDLTLFVPFYRKWMFDGLSSFKYEAAHDWLKTQLWRFDEHKLHIRTVKCEVKKLDDFKLKPYFVKIDVQGYELEVLKGAMETLKNFKPIILIESIDSETKHFLQQFNYGFYSFVDGKFIADKGMVNTFCITSDKLGELSKK
ncbi:FkbM family methyltransferase [Adhaeribacter pallidiroseus]|uniref:Methyltransferase FkbM domain-containing protein n=1 Tax=Adhaeribacter pallidiroseus TaxID=2072847 RepID=A0A369QSW7_9BACT|nr:FkbM family methyltransferase [Adhaeribacter pallidiroseus]RDC65919.1 hypothetical protein AHMF7616_04550 [Adhaeribacter pallidiroseus]